MPRARKRRTLERFGAWTVSRGVAFGRVNVWEWIDWREWLEFQTPKMQVLPIAQRFWQTWSMDPGGD